MSGERVYTEQEVEQILRLASNQSSGGINRDRLLKMAEELGISSDAISRAESEVRLQNDELKDRQEFDRYHRRSFFSHLGYYVAINAGLVMMNLLTSNGHVDWAIWPILGWGIGLGSHLIGTFVKGTKDYEEDFEKWRGRRHGYGKLAADPQIKVGIHTSVNSPQSGAGVLDLLPHVENIALRENLTKIETIKRVREETGAGLKESKDAVELFQRQNPGIIRY